MAAKSFREAVDLLYSWKYHAGDNFSSLLFNLITKADAANRARLQAAFPLEFRAWSMWLYSVDEKEFFDDYAPLNKAYVRPEGVKRGG